MPLLAAKLLACHWPMHGSKQGNAECVDCRRTLPTTHCPPPRRLASGIWHLPASGICPHLASGICPHLPASGIWHLPASGIWARCRKNSAVSGAEHGSMGTYLQKTCRTGFLGCRLTGQGYTHLYIHS